MFGRAEIIETLRGALESLPYVNAMWLEGADATGHVDQYSDIDLYIDIADEFEAESISAVEQALTSLAPIAYRHVINHPHPKLRQRIYHLQGTDEHLMIDFCWQLESRDRAECTFIEGDGIEAAMVLFDKKQVVRYRDYSSTAQEDASLSLLADCRYRFSQLSRVRKYIRRGTYLEAYAYYHRYVFDPLVSLLRLIHTPAHPDYYLIHISRHLPSSEVMKLEFFAQVSSLGDIEERIPLAETWFHELLSALA